MSIYAVNKLCRRVVFEPELREALTSDRAAAVEAVANAKPPLSPEETALFLDGEVGQLSLMGANDFLLTMLARWEVLGLSIPLYADRIRVAYRGRVPTYNGR